MQNHVNWRTIFRATTDQKCLNGYFHYMSASHRFCETLCIFVLRVSHENLIQVIYILAAFLCCHCQVHDSI